MRSVKLAILFFCKAIGMFSLAKRMTRGRLRILCYHGFSLADEAEFRPMLFITPRTFEKRLSSIKRYSFDVVHLNDAVAQLYSGSLRANALVITADDGFHSFHKVAVPLLRHHGYPATAYVTTYHVQKGSPVFRLVIQYMFWRTRKSKLELRKVPWTEDQEVDLSSAPQAERAIWECINYGERQCTEDERAVICETMGRLLDTPYAKIVESKILNLMSPNELRSLADANIDIGLHTHRHTFPVDDRVLAEREIADNEMWLRMAHATAVRHFCYPSGEFEEWQWTWLKELGIQSSTTCIPGLNSKDTPRHALHRFLDGERIHQLEFEAAISGFTDFLRDFGRVRTQGAR
jgi:peptidoglycan/xylan/chitin deacetylase (PgdA/CDA1 family)